MTNKARHRLKKKPKYTQSVWSHLYLELLWLRLVLALVLLRLLLPLKGLFHRQYLLQSTLGVVLLYTQLKIAQLLFEYIEDQLPEPFEKDIEDEKEPGPEEEGEEEQERGKAIVAQDKDGLVQTESSEEIVESFEGEPGGDEEHEELDEETEAAQDEADAKEEQSPASLEEEAKVSHAKSEQIQTDDNEEKPRQCIKSIPEIEPM